MASLTRISHWEREADVVIIGSGMAGAVAAIEAFDTDPSAHVLVLEKMPAELRGGSGRCAGGFMYAPGPDSVEDLKDYHRALSCPYTIPEDVLDAWAIAVSQQRPWLERVASDVGTRFERLPDLVPDFPDFPGSGACEHIYTVEGPSGVWSTFFANVEKRGISVLYETPAVDLIQDPDTLEVFGVVASERGKRTAIKARRAVILCTGGFAANSEMQLEYRGYHNMFPLGAPASTGDGVRMLQAAGAELWHMPQVGGIFPGIAAPGMRCAFMREFITASSWIDIAKDNTRFYDEIGDYYYNHFKVNYHGNWVDPPLTQVLPIHMIFDENTRLAGKIAQDSSGWNMIALAYDWSVDNSAEIEKGWIVKAGSMGELATLIGRGPKEVESTVRRYNEFCNVGLDSDFGRVSARLKAIERAPFYAVEIFPSLAATSGGGRRTANAEVLSTRGRPIARLYEAGELGSTFANLYQNGSYITEAIAFGRIAGRNASAQTRWDAPD